MIRKPSILILMIAMTLFLMSCEEEYIIDTGDFESKLVVNAMFNNDSPWLVNVSNTTNILDNYTTNEKITDAIVEIYDQNDEFLYQLFHQGNGEYGREDYAPSPKRDYSVKVSAPGYHTVTAKSFVPEKSTLLINNFAITPNEKYNDVEVDFEIEDKSKLQSYYIWEIVSLEEGVQGGGNDNPNQLSQTWINDLTNNPNDLIRGSREILEGGSFGNGTYQGSYNSLDGNRRIGRRGTLVGEAFTPLLSYSHEINTFGKLDPKVNHQEEVLQNELLDGDDDPEEGDDPQKIVFKYELRVMSISKELYDYYSSVEEYLQHSDNNHSNQVPLEIYTNVSGGFGIFAGFSESVIQF